ncbi:TPA: DUF1648 domain-containing protein [Streptococcus suis]
MKKIDIKTLFATSGIFLLIALLTIYYYGALPDTMVTHFGVNGEPNGSMAKYMVTILTPLLFFCVHLFICVLYDVKGIGKHQSFECSNGFFRYWLSSFKFLYSGII